MLASAEALLREVATPPAETESPPPPPPSSSPSSSSSSGPRAAAPTVGWGATSYQSTGDAPSQPAAHDAPAADTTGRADVDTAATGTYESQRGSSGGGSGVAGSARGRSPLQAGRGKRSAAQRAVDAEDIAQQRRAVRSLSSYCCLQVPYSATPTPAAATLLPPHCCRHPRVPWRVCTTIFASPSTELLVRSLAHRPNVSWSTRSKPRASSPCSRPRPRGRPSPSASGRCRPIGSRSCTRES